MRRALMRLQVPPAYVLTDGFPVAGLGVPGLAVWKGDRVAACIAAASVLAKVTRDRIMAQLHEHYPAYGFAEHKGYVNAAHNAAIAAHGPCPQHRFSYINVARRAPDDRRIPVRTLVRVGPGDSDADLPDADLPYDGAAEVVARDNENAADAWAAAGPGE
jgi:hypothetical protein